MDIKIIFTGDKLVFGLFVLMALTGVMVDGMEDYQEGNYFWAAFSLFFVALFSHVYWTNWRHKIL